MIHTKIDGDKVNIPTRWSEVSFRLFIEVALKGNSLTGQLAILMKMPEETLLTSKFSESLDTIFAATKYLAVWPSIQKYPKTCGPYILGENIETMGQLNAITEQCQLSGNSTDLRVQLQCLANIAAIYCQGIGERFDKEKALYMGQGQFMDLSCEDVLSAGNYFMSKALATVTSKPIDDFRKGIKFSEPPSFFKRIKDKWHSHFQ